VVIEHRAAAGFRRRDDESLDRLRGRMSRSDAIADGSDPPCQARVRRAFLGHRGPSSRDVIDLVDSNEPADQRVGVAAQLDRAQVGIGFMRLHPARAQPHRGEHADHREDPGPRLESWNDEGSHAGARHQQHDEQRHRDVDAEEPAAVELLEVRNLVGKNRGDLLGWQQVEQ
jgi:hypothetical protein